jgi:hypothetical protein
VPGHDAVDAEQDCLGNLVAVQHQQHPFPPTPRLGLLQLQSLGH